MNEERNQFKSDEIRLYDPIGITEKKCQCGNNAKFILGIYGHFIILCETCLGEVGKTVIDGLV